MSKSIPRFRPKKHKNHTLWRRTYLYSLYKGVPPSSGPYARRCGDEDARTGENLAQEVQTICKLLAVNPTTALLANVHSQLPGV